MGVTYARSYTCGCEHGDLCSGSQIIDDELEDWDVDESESVGFLLIQSCAHLRRDTPQHHQHHLRGRGSGDEVQRL